MVRRFWVRLAMQLLLVAVSMYFGFILYEEFMPSKVITLTREITKEVPVEVIKEVQVIKEVPVETIITRTVHPDFRLFKDIQEFKDWYEENSFTYLGGDCDDLAETYVQLAAEDGFLIGYQYVSNNGILGTTRVRPFGSVPHIGLLVMTQNNMIFYAEPETGETFFINYRD